MRQPHRLFVLNIALASWAAATSYAQTPQDYPNRPVRIIVTQAPGSGVDIQTRALAQKLTDLWGQVVVDNRVGANGIIGMEIAARSKPDGYTLIHSSLSVITMNPFIYKKLPYDTFRDFVPITQTAINTMGLVVNTGFPAKNAADLIAFAKARPGELTYGSFGIGNATHLLGELLSDVANIKITHVPYKGQTPALTALMGNEVSLVFTTVMGVTQHVDAGKLRLISTLGETRDPAFPSTPTMRESGYPEVVLIGWSGLLAPAGLSRDICDLIYAEVARLLILPDVRDAFTRQGATAVSSTPDQFARYIKSEAEKWSKVIRKAGLENSQ